MLGFIFFYTISNIAFTALDKSASREKKSFWKCYNGILIIYEKADVAELIKCTHQLTYLGLGKIIPDSMGFVS